MTRRAWLLALALSACAAPLDCPETHGVCLYGAHDAVPYLQAAEFTGALAGRLGLAPWTPGLIVEGNSDYPCGPMTVGCYDPCMRTAYIMVQEGAGNGFALRLTVLHELWHAILFSNFGDADAGHGHATWNVTYREGAEWAEPFREPIPTSQP